MKIERDTGARAIVRSVLFVLFVPIGIWHTVKASPVLVKGIWDFITSVFG